MIEWNQNGYYRVKWIQQYTLVDIWAFILLSNSIWKDSNTVWLWISEMVIAIQEFLFGHKIPYKIVFLFSGYVPSRIRFSILLKKISHAKVIYTLENTMKVLKVGAWCSWINAENSWIKKLEIHHSDSIKKNIDFGKLYIYNIHVKISNEEPEWLD